MVLQRAPRGKVGDRERLLGQDAEEALDLVQPRGACGRVMKVNARMGLEPGADLVGVVRGGVVEHDVELLVGIGAVRATFFMKRRKSVAVWRALNAWVTLPVATSSAANRSTTPWRR